MWTNFRFIELDDVPLGNWCTQTNGKYKRTTGKSSISHAILAELGGRRTAMPGRRKTPPALDAEPGAISIYNSIFSTSATNRPLSSARNEATTLNTASLKPPTFRMSLRSGAWVVVYD